MFTTWEDQELPKERAQLTAVADAFGDWPSGSEAILDHLLDLLEPLGPLTWKAMFGGYGVYVGKGMFCILDSGDRVALRVDEMAEIEFTVAGSERIGRLGFWTVPEEILNHPRRFVEYAKSALALSVELKKTRFRY